MSDQSQEPLQAPLPEGEALADPAEQARLEAALQAAADAGGSPWLIETLRILHERFGDELRELAQ